MLNQEDDDWQAIDAGGQLHSPTTLNRFAIGWAWEEWLATQEADRGLIFHPGEYTLDGMTGEPDAVEDDGKSGIIVHEFKITWKSLRTFDDWFWLTQIKAYCKMVGTRRAVLSVMFINGDYKPPSPVFKRWECEFTELELEENWDMLLRHGRKHLGLT